MLGEIWVPILIYGGIGLFGVIAFILAIKSRKTYRCPSCGEAIRTEYLDARRCGMCGAPLTRED